MSAERQPHFYAPETYTIAVTDLKSMRDSDNK
jgi:hypothetical protein